MNDQPQSAKRPLTTPLVQLNQPPRQRGTEVTVSSTTPLEVPAASPPPITDQSSPAELVAWGMEFFADRKMVITSSFGMEGCALLDMCNKAIESKGLEPVTVAYIDTEFFFPETHDLRRKLTERYQALNFVKWQTEVSVAEQAQQYGNELWKTNPNMCCHIRKVVPMQENIGNYDVWVTALRRSQTRSRSDTEVVSFDWRYQILKFCPFAFWQRKDVWQYIQDHDVPFNKLHLQGYPSVSCFHCTQAVPGATPDTDSRAGRWEGKDKNECGLHYNI